MTRKLKVGDVIKSNRFRYGYLGDVEGPPCSRLKRIIMAGVTNVIDEERISEDKRVAMALRTGKKPPKIVRNSHYRNNKSRARSEFVVIEMGHYSSSGERGSCSADWILVQRLKQDGTFNLNGGLLWFYTNGDIAACNYIDQEEITIVRQMEHSFR